MASPTRDATGLDPAALRARAAILRALRGALHDEGFLEVHPPVLVSGPALEENLEALPCAEGWLHTSPEFALKRVLASGLHRIYAITPVFRDEEHGSHHRREFTMLELYLAGGNYRDLMPLVERLIAAGAAAVAETPPVFQRVSVADLFGGTVPLNDDEFYRRWVEEIDPTLTEPTWVLDYPARQAALAEVRGSVSERLELYLGGLELGNGFSELRDGEELRSRFAASAAARLARGRAPHPTDEGVIDATARLPRSAGIAIGVDRLVMALLGMREIGAVTVAG